MATNRTPFQISLLPGCMTLMEQSQLDFLPWLGF